jgi:hypothetical protein
MVAPGVTESDDETATLFFVELNADAAQRVRADASEHSLQRPRHDAAAFFLLGLLNNAGYVIMNAGAREIQSGGVALVYMAGVFPSFMVTQADRAVLVSQDPVRGALVRRGAAVGRIVRARRPQ